MELQRVVSGQRDHESSGQVLGQRVSMVAQEQAVVAQRRHGDANLGQVVKILQDWSLSSIQGDSRDKDNPTVRQLSAAFWKEDAFKVVVIIIICFSVVYNLRKYF